MNGFVKQEAIDCKVGTQASRFGSLFEYVTGIVCTVCAEAGYASTQDYVHGIPLS